MHVLILMLSQETIDQMDCVSICYYHRVEKSAYIW